MKNQQIYFDKLDDLNTTTYDSCGEDFLQIFESGFLPSFFLNTGTQVGEDFTVWITDKDGNNDFLLGDYSATYANTEAGTFAFIDKQASAIPSGIFRIKVKGDFETTDFVLSDTYLFKDDVSCLSKIEISNDCNYNAPYSRVPDFKYEFYLNEDCQFQNPSYLYEEEFKELANGDDISIKKSYEKGEVFSLFKIGRRTYQTIIEGGTMDYFNIFSEGTDSDLKILEKSFDTLNYDRCCIFNAQITLKREQSVNNGCCDDNMTDCVDFELTEVNNIDNEIQIIQSVGGTHIGCYASIEFSGTGINQVLCSDTNGNWLSYTPKHFLDLSTNFYYELQTNGYYSQVNYLSSISQVSNNNFDLSIGSMNFQSIDIYSQYNGNGYNFVDSLEIGDLTNVINVFNYTLVPDSTSTSGLTDIDVKLIFKNVGCSQVESVFSGQFNIIPST